MYVYTYIIFKFLVIYTYTYMHAVKKLVKKETLNFLRKESTVVWESSEGGWARRNMIKL